MWLNKETLSKDQKNIDDDKKADASLSQIVTLTPTHVPTSYVGIRSRCWLQLKS